jgi:hypothetical protein
MVMETIDGKEKRAIYVFILLPFLTGITKANTFLKWSVSFPR